MAKEPAGKEPAKFKVMDNPAVAESYANKLISASYDGGAVAITLGTIRFVPETSTDQPKQGVPQPLFVTARIALSPAGAVELANALNNMLKMLRDLLQKAPAAKPQ
jgi:hypothetical protein